MFGIWAYIRVLIMITAGEERQILKDFFASLAPDELGAGWAIVIATILFIGVFIILVHLYIGLSAIRQGRGTGKKKRGFLILAAVFAFLNLLGIISYVFPLVMDVSVEINERTAQSVPLLTRLASFLMDMTAFAMYAEIVFCGLRLRLWQSRLTGGSQEGAA